MLINIAKLAIVVALLLWMIQTDKLNLSQMSIFVTNPFIIMGGLLCWLIGPVFIGSWRWWLLLRGAGLECTYTRAVGLQLVGFFFNTAMPGAVGGDIVKAIYIVNDQKNGARKTPAMLTVLLDRIVGLIGLFSMGAIVAMLSYRTMIQNPVTARLMVGLAAVMLCSVIFLSLVLIPYPGNKDPFENILRLDIPGFPLVLKIYQALRFYRHQPKILFFTIVLSIVLQTMQLVFMGFVGAQLYPGFNYSLLTPIFPFGTLATALPLAPGGLGVGHAAFEKLFSMVGLPGGANVFNIYTLSQLALNLLCFVAYLAIKKQGKVVLSEQSCVS